MRPLEGIRVVDLASVPGVYCSRLWANLGADVIKVEPPGGDAERDLGPFYKDVPGRSRSLHYWYYNTDKRSVTLSLQKPEGRDLFRRLVKTADIVLETFPPGYMVSLGLGYEEMSALNPRLVMTAITPFGQTGPWRDYKAADLVSMALGTLLNVLGSPQRPPVRLGGEQTWHTASVHASAATMVALHHAEMTGDGQFVDVAIHQCIPLCLQHIVLDYIVTGNIPGRIGTDSPYPVYGHFECKNGWIYVTLRDQWREFVQWLKEYGAEEDLGDPAYEDVNYQRERRRHIDEVFQRFVRNRLKLEVCIEAQQHRLWAVPTNSVADVFADPQLTARNFFVEVPYPQWGMNVRYPGVPYRLSVSPASIRSAAPDAGQHNQDVYVNEIGLTPSELAALQSRGVV